MDLLNNITNFVANVIERVRQAVLFPQPTHVVGGSGGGGGVGGGMVLWGL